MKKINLVLISLIILTMLAGCYRNAPVESYQVGLVMNDGVSISEVVGPGLYSNGGWRAELYTINVSNITTSWQDPSLVTRDKQPIGLTMSITFSRKRDSESIKELYNRYNAEAINDESLKNLVHSKVPGVAKTITTKYTLDQMLGISEPISGTQTIDRGVVAQEVFNLLDAELNQIFVDLVAVEIADISASETFMAALDAKAKAQIDIEVAQQQTKLITEQLAQEKAQTEIELERARRTNEVNAVTAQAYEESPQLLELRKLELIKGIIGAGDVVIYVPEGTDITSVLTQQAVVPVQ
jgi:hypothetical protein